MSNAISEELASLDSTITLTEYQKRGIQKERIRSKEAEQLWRDYGKVIDVEFPTVRTENQWQLTPQGYVGQIKLDNLEIRLNPKVGLDNLFGLIEYAYDLKLDIKDKEVGIGSINEIFERLALILSKRVIDRTQRGLYREYQGRNEKLALVRGRIDPRKLINKPWEPALHCHFQQHTPDLIENQILLSALVTTLRTGICTDRTLPTIREALRGLKGNISEKSLVPEDCTKRTYNRLNFDYEPMHSISRFILEHTGPTHKSGDRNLLPFMINMNQLYERFVAEWLRLNSPEDLVFDAHEVLSFGKSNQVSFDIDLVLRDAATQIPIAVLDTKYKAPDSPANADIFQVIAYAESLNCQNAFLVFPKRFHTPLDITVGRIRVRSACFAVDGDFENRGHHFIEQLVTGLQI